MVEENNKEPESVSEDSVLESQQRHGPAVPTYVHVRVTEFKFLSFKVQKFARFPHLLLHNKLSYNIPT